MLVVDWNDAVHLARAREQRALAYRIGVLRAEHKNSVADVALILDEGRGTLTSKLNGHIPATEDDLIPLKLAKPDRSGDPCRHSRAV